MDSPEQLEFEKDTKVIWAPKLYKLFKVTHSSNIPWYVSEINSPEDYDYQFMNNRAINKFLFPEGCVVFNHHFDTKLSFERVTSAIKEKIIETIWQGSPIKLKSDKKNMLDQYIPKYYFATLKDQKGDKKYMTVCNLYINIVNGNIEQSVIITDNERSIDEANQLVCSASLCLVSDQPIFQFQ